MTSPPPKPPRSPGSTGPSGPIRPDRPESGGAASDRRRWGRAIADLPVSVALSGGRSEARLRDISRSGVCFFLDRPIPLMTVLEMSVALPVKAGVRHVNGHGAVVRCERIARRVDHYEVAVFLHEMAESDRRAIEEFVASGMTRGGGPGVAPRT